MRVPSDEALRAPTNAIIGFCKVSMSPITLKNGGASDRAFYAA